MKKLMFGLVCLVWVGSASAFQPRTGHWWNPAESGRGFNIDVQDGVLVVTVYTYQAGGAAQWYLSSGPMTNSGRNFTGTLDKYQGGQCISCGYAGRPTLVGNDGTISISFTSETAATLTLPGGRTTNIQPYNFGFGEPPQGLLGEWVFVHDESITLAVKYNLTTLLSATSTGNGIVAGLGITGDASRITGCELQTSDLYAGQVVCADADATGNLKNLYYFRYGLDETFAGNWVSASGTIQSTMKGFRTKSEGGYTRTGIGRDASAASVPVPIAPFGESKLEQKSLLGTTGSPDPILEERGRVIIDAIRRASNLL
jgi:hypothetical protein